MDYYDYNRLKNGIITCSIISVLLAVIYCFIYNEIISDEIDSSVSHFIAFVFNYAVVLFPINGLYIGLVFRNRLWSVICVILTAVFVLLMFKFNSPNIYPEFNLTFYILTLVGNCISFIFIYRNPTLKKYLISTFFPIILSLGLGIAMFALTIWIFWMLIKYCIIIPARREAFWRRFWDDL